MKTLDFFKINNSYKTAKVSLLLTVLVGVVSYNSYFIHGYTNADGIVEGLTSFSNATWVITGCGRWLLAIILALSGNVVMPLFAVIGYAFNAWLASFFICKLFNIKSSLLITLSSIILSISPAVTTQFTLNAIAFPYSISMLLATLFVYINHEYNNAFSYIICSFCMTASLGIFQNYAGFAACLVVMIMSIMFIKQTDIKSIIKFSLRSLLTAVVGFILYFVALRLILYVFHLSTSSRMSELSVISIARNMFNGMINAYKYYFITMNDNVFARNLVFILFAFIVIIVLFSLNNIKIYNRLFSLLFFLLVPLASNIICLVLPGEGISVPMTHQNILIIPFSFAISSYATNNKFFVYLKTSLCLLTSFLIFSYIVSANATFSCYRLSYRYMYGQMSQVVYDIEHNEDYVLNETPVIIVGYFEDTELRKNIRTYKYAIDLPENLVFWKVPVGVTYNRQKYFMNYFGIDFKDIKFLDYQNVINTNEFKQMNNWPNKESIRMIGDFLVVKISDNYIE